jgi:hypothetical protein
LAGGAHCHAWALAGSWDDNAVITSAIGHKNRNALKP